MYHRFKLKLIIADCLTKLSGGGMKKTDSCFLCKHDSGNTPTCRINDKNMQHDK